MLNCLTIDPVKKRASPHALDCHDRSNLLACRYLLTLKNIHILKLLIRQALMQFPLPTLFPLKVSSYERITIHHAGTKRSCNLNAS
jgi:hypothetical protein